MECLYCGNCCQKMSPLTDSEDEPCPHIVNVKSFVFCSIYKQKRPQQCVDHDFPARYCPIGVNVLKLKNLQEIARRIDEGWELSKTI